MANGHRLRELTTAVAGLGHRHRGQGSRRRFPALRNPRRLGPALRTWSRQPHGRVVVPGLFLCLLVALTGASGALLVPQEPSPGR